MFTRLSISSAFLCPTQGEHRTSGPKRRVDLERALKSQGTNSQSDLFLMSFKRYLKFVILSTLVRLRRYLAMWFANMDEHNKLLKASYFVVRSLPKQMGMERETFGVNCFNYIDDTKNFINLQHLGNVLILS